jgi:hypothetical protein
MPSPSLTGRDDEDRSGKPSLEDKLRKALLEIVALDVRPYTMPADHWAQIGACPECARYKDHPVQQGICNTHRQPFWARERHENHEQKILGYRAQEIAQAALSQASGGER